MRKTLIILAVLIGLCVGYLAGCRSHVPARAVQPEPHEGQHWIDQSGHVRIVRTVTHDTSTTTVWWYYPNAKGKDRHCLIATWRQWVRAKGGRIEYGADR